MIVRGWANTRVRPLVKLMQVENPPRHRVSWLLAHTTLITWPHDFAYTWPVRLRASSKCYGVEWGGRAFVRVGCRWMSSKEVTKDKDEIGSERDRPAVRHEQSPRYVELVQDEVAHIQQNILPAFDSYIATCERQVRDVGNPV